MYDAIVIGARCAGASTAMLLAREGFEVLLVDRARRGSEIPHGHFIHRHGPRRLRDWGLLDRILATGCPPVTSMTMDFGDFPLSAGDLTDDGVPAALGPRRAALDAVLADAAAEAGAQVREGFAVADLVFDGDRVAGVRTPSGATERARLVIGADGRNSGVAKRVGAPSYEAVPTLTCWYFSYWSGVPGDGLELYVRDRRVTFAFPTNDGLFAVFVAWPIDELPVVRADTERELLAVLDAIPGLGERVRAGRREERLYGATQLPNFLRRPYGPGWALVGDAGVHKDPFMALGVCDALRDAELLATAASGVLRDGTADTQALAEYEQQRNAATLPDYAANLHQARLEPPPPELLALRAAARGNPEMERAFLLRAEGIADAARRPDRSTCNPEGR